MSLSFFGGASGFSESSSVEQKSTHHIQNRNGGERRKV
jgi:hypothetical protein